MSALPITVVKIGGSLSSSAQLAAWLDALATCAGCVVVVPGGGPFADTVRAAQRRLNFADRAAHAMALLAMEQYGWALTGLHPRFRMAESVEAIKAGLQSSAIPVWAPAGMVLAASDVAESWDVTSDSLAVWLAARLGVERALLVKRGERTAQPATASELARLAVVDPAFPAFLKARQIQVSIVSEKRAAEAAMAIRAGLPYGSPVVLSRPDRAVLHV